ncbi:hypothetical protein ACFQHO_50910 [Actinomadura yumaensis]|uniref:hypothetical protein n=1 Tax=Actinomadura yumaensis TaxID=111807 RepID=UPI003614AEAF
MARWAAPAAVLGAVGLGATGLAAASSGASEPSPGPSASSSHGTEHGNGWRGGWGGQGGWGGHWGGPGAGRFQGALHGECVMAKDGGGTETRVFQRGTVTGVNGSSFTVRSSDGFTQRYGAAKDLTVNGEKKGPGAVPQGKEVMVIALKGGGDPAAQRVFSWSH